MINIIHFDRIQRQMQILGIKINIEDHFFNLQTKGFLLAPRFMLNMLIYGRYELLMFDLSYIFIYCLLCFCQDFIGQVKILKPVFLRSQESK